jgi:hypothetical protein
MGDDRRSDRVPSSPPDQPGRDTPVRSVVVTIGQDTVDLDACVLAVERLACVTLADAIVCDVRGLREPELREVDLLARICLTAQRLGVAFHMVHAPPPLRELIGLVGLADVLAPTADSGSEAVRQTEQREQAGSVEERVQADDPLT